MSTMSSTGATSSPTSTPASSGSAASRTPNLGAIIGGAVGGAAALLWILALLWWANRHSWFRRPGYKRHRDSVGAFGKRSPAITPTTESAGHFAQPPQPQMGMLGARTFGQPPPVPPPPPVRMSFGDPPRPSYGDPPRPIFERTSFGDLPRPAFGAAPPVPNVPPKPNPAPPAPRSSSGFGIIDRPRSSFGDRPISTFGDRPRSGFGDRPRSGFGDRRSLSPDRVRRFFGGGGNKNDEWEGAGRRVSVEPGTPEMEDRGGVMGFFARAKESAARRKRVKAEYEEDMRRMRGRSIVESDYGRY
ncbi:hypothetical protein BN14_11513 [Rhizoctonia solani AG-1 IB]|uniref:Transmembrane protein n=1 Tax=Thanatephorus cucumeris (strain AG1-IB / isolate 7/3/14) TaxID=1108050 RepID=M5CBI2_THACB|nr:hypothetical protein BN14_11513 [Rhizoctonia solani AG-1 IB]